MTVKEIAKHAGRGQGLAYLLIAEGRAAAPSQRSMLPSIGTAEQGREENER